MNQSKYENYENEGAIRGHDVFSRPGQSQGLLCKHLCYLLTYSLTDPLGPTALRRRHAQMVRDRSSSYKIDFVIVIKTFLNSERHQKSHQWFKSYGHFTERGIFPMGEGLREPIP